MCSTSKSSTFQIRKHISALWLKTKVVIMQVKWSTIKWLLLNKHLLVYYRFYRWVVTIDEVLRCMQLLKAERGANFNIFT